MSNKLKIVFISHTHWDREWYYTFDQYRYRLIHCIDKLLEILEKRGDFHSFMMDGQVAPIEDYLEIRPEKRALIEKYVKEGRLKIGPWYIQPDEFLVEGESMIRNLMLGIRTAEKFGGYMKIGYLPDTFGHTAQMPQILRKFGIDNFVFHRGIGTEFEELGTPFIWQAPDGSKVIALFLYRGYCNIHRITEDFERSLPLLHDLYKLWKDKVRVPVIPGMIGCDHHLPKEFVPDFEKYVKGVEGLPFDVEQGDMEKVIEVCREHYDELKEHSGELLSSHYHWVLYGTWSARVYLKQLNFENEVSLTHLVEPIWTMAWLLGGHYPSELIWKAWKYVILSQPHDSICGCSIDEVHKECEVRQLKAKTLIRELLYCGGKEFNMMNYFLTAAGINIEGYAIPSINSKIDLSFNRNAKLYLVAYNTLPWSRRSVVKLRTHKKFALSKEIYERLKALAKFTPLEQFEEMIKREGLIDLSFEKVVLRDPEGKVIPCQVRPVYGDLVEIVWVDELPPLGFKAYSIEEGEASEVKSDIIVGEDFIENEYFKVSFDLEHGGCITIEDKRTGFKYSGLNVFEDGGDIGDEYDYSPPEVDKVIKSTSFKASLEFVEKGPVVATAKVTILMKIPKSLSPDRKSRSKETILLPMKCYVSLYSRVPRVDVKVNIYNLAKDHRLRAVFPLGSKSSKHWAETHFHVIERGNETPYYYRRPDGSVVKVKTYPMRSWVDLSDGEKGLCIVTKGLHEYEVRETNDNTEAVITLMRCVGWLSRPDLLTRPGNAGPFVPTPDAQCLRKLTFEYSIIPHSGTWLETGVHRLAKEFVVPTISHEEIPHRGMLPPETSYMSLEPRDVIMTTFKKAEDEDAIIVRIFNVSGRGTEAKLNFFKHIEDAWIVDLNEKNVSKAKREEKSVYVELKPHEIVTVKVRFIPSTP